MKKIGAIYEERREIERDHVREGRGYGREDGKGMVRGEKERGRHDAA